MWVTNPFFIASSLSVAIFTVQNLIRRQRRRNEANLAPYLSCDISGEVRSIESFGDYVVRQLKISPEHGSAPTLAKAANDYLRGDKTKADTSREQLLHLISNACASVSENHCEELAKMLIAELDACMLTYFAFHWKHASMLVDQVIHGSDPKMKFKKAVMLATSASRVQKVMQTLGPQRKLSVLLEELKILSTPEHSPKAAVPTKGEVLIPAKESVRSPVLLLIGGGMGAGKSTVVQEVMKSPFWSKVACDAVVVEADAFKEKDVIYQTLMAQNVGDNAKISQMVHESSTQAASSMLVTALNEGRDVIFDGTMSWAPFVHQTLAMVREAHRRRHRLGPGYRRLPGGGVLERYWEPVGEEEAEGGSESLPSSPSPGGPAAAANGKARLPYRVEVVGVVCDAHLAVMRGMRRAILTGRGVPVEGQLRSHKLFAESLENYAEMVDKTTIYSTNGIGKPAELIAYKEGKSKLLVDVESMEEVKQLAGLNTKADNALELFSSPKRGWIRQFFLGRKAKVVPGTAWNSVVMSTERSRRQAELREAFLKLQAVAWNGNRSDLLRRNSSKIPRSKSAPSFGPRASSLDGFRGSN